jgi:hypothetical protein
MLSREEYIYDYHCRWYKYNIYAGTINSGEINCAGH